MKSIVYIISCIFSLTANAGWFGFGGFKNGPDPLPNDQALMDRIYNEGGLKEPHGKLVGKVPKSYQEITQEGADAPIEIIQARHRASSAYWQDPPTEHIQILKLLELDVSSLKELNLRAFDIWERLVACNSGNPETARSAFFRGTKLCGDSTDDKEVLIALGELGRNYQQFLFSSPLLNLSRMGSLWAGRDILYSIHPLISQMAILQWSHFLNHAAEKRSPISDAILSAALTEEYNDSIKQFKSFNPNPEDIKKHLKPTRETQRMLLGIFINNMAFLAFLAADQDGNSCQIYGLWPAMNRVILYKPELWNGLTNTYFKNFKAVHDKAVKNCGQEVKYINFGTGIFGIYAQSGTSHISEMRRIYQQWMGVSWQPRN